MRRIIPLFFVFVLMFSGVAQAADAVIDAAGAASLKKLVEDDLQWRVDMAKVFGEGLAIDGKVEVTPKGGFYEVRLPSLSVLAGPEGRLDIGIMILNVAPGPQPGAWLIQQATLPSSMTYYDAKDAPLVRVSIGTQRIQATWVPEKSMYPQIDSLIENIQITGTGENAPVAKINTLKSLSNLKDNGDGTWTGPIDFESSGIVLNVPGKNPVTLGIGKISSHNVYDRLDMSQSLKMKEVAKKSMKEKLPQTDKEKQAFLAQLLTQSPVSADSMEGAIGIDDFFMHDTGAPPQQPQRTIALDHVVIDGITSNTRQEKSKAFVKLAFSGLRLPSIPPALADLMPQSMNAEITLDNLPVKAMMGQFFTLVQKSVAAAGDKTDAAAQDAAKAELTTVAVLLPKMLQDAGTTLSVDNTYVKSATVDATLKARIEAKAAAVIGAIGKMTLTFKGLDEAVQKMQGMALTAGADPHILGYFAGLTALEMKGQPDKAADGKSLRNYILELKESGDMLLNGVVVNPRGTPADAGQPKPATPPFGMSPPHMHPMMPAPMPAQP